MPIEKLAGSIKEVADATGEISGQLRTNCGAAFIAVARVVAARWSSSLPSVKLG